NCRGVQRFFRQARKATIARPAAEAAAPPREKERRSARLVTAITPIQRGARSEPEGCPGVTGREVVERTSVRWATEAITPIPTKWAKWLRLIKLPQTTRSVSRKGWS